MKFFTLLLSVFCLSFFSQAQNGTLDRIEDLFTIKSVYVNTPDGASLATDLYLPMTSDSLMIDIDIPGIGTGRIELLQNGVQYIYYPTLDSMPNPNPYQLPVIFTRTTYGKDDMAALGYVFAVLGYAVAIQDNRGINGSNDLYMPLFTDGWDKTPYTDYVPSLIFPSGYEGNPSTYEDGLYSLDYILNDWTRDYDINEDGIVDFIDKTCNGSIFYFGASALSNSGILMALARKQKYNEPGLKGFLNIIASSEHYNSTLFSNGMFKKGLVEGWVNGQIGSFREDTDGTDDSWYNFIHTYSDFGLSNRQETLNSMLNILSVEQAEEKAVSYPNSNLRTAFDGSRAYVDENGNGDAFGAYSRYSNLDMPIYHVAGWFDIFLDGQLKMWRESKKHMDVTSPNYNKQKLIIGPWQHYYPAVQTAGDLTFPPNVGDVIGVTGNIETDEGIMESLLNLDLEALLKSELFSFIRTSANFNEYKNVGTPLIRFPKNPRYQQLLGNFLIQIPASDYTTTHADLINFLGGEAPLSFFPAKIYLKIGNDTISLGNLNLTIPPLPDFITDIFGGISEEFGEFPLFRDFSAIPEVRFYVCGPINDSIPENANMGNYWIETDTFPITDGLDENILYLHNNGTLSLAAPDEAEEPISYIHDPNNPVRTIGGNNLEIKTPDNRESMGPLNLADSLYAPLTMNRPDVIAFISEPFEDSVQIMGNIKAKIFASSLAEGDAAGDPTDTDFIVRLLDVYPNGGEYLITEGNVNARYREYAKSIALGNEDDDAPISNLEADKIYEFMFEMLPTAYVFGKEHQLKILISSSNYPRYQSSPNIPIENFDFFRWKSGENMTYTYEGVTYQERNATNSIHFTPEYPSQIILPLRGRQIEYCGEPDSIFVTELTDSTAVLNWRGAMGTTNYLVRYKTVDATEWTEIIVANTTVALENLEGAQYLWEVASICRDTSLYSETDTFITFLPTSVINNSSGQYAKLYPNPTSSILHLEVLQGNWNANMFIYNKAGQFIKQVQLNQSSQKIDVNDLPNGDYMIHLISKDNQLLVLPFIKM
jgi:predicted acyl esterase